MKRILEQSNLDLYRAIEISYSLLHNDGVIPEAELYKSWLSDAFIHIRDQVKQNIKWLDLNYTSIFPEVLNRTQELSRDYKFIVSRLMPSIYRQRSDDVLCLKVLNWLHDQHDQSKSKPFAISDGGFAIYPSKHIPVIYFLPISSQHSLLYLSLFFHEFGHYLYQYHEDEMDDLVKEFQEKLEDYLEPSFQQNDQQSQRQKDKIRIIVETWYEWAQELYCDAVGLQIGGRSYLKAFSYHLRMNGRGAFIQKESDLERSSHPVLWLRVMFLSQRAKDLGLVEDGEEIYNEWNSIAGTLGISPDYYGYYSDHYYQDVMQMISDMLIETAPISFLDYETSLTDFDSEKHNFVQLLNLAWNNYENSISDYPQWESNVIEQVVSK